MHLKSKQALTWKGIAEAGAPVDVIRPEGSQLGVLWPEYLVRVVKGSCESFHVSVGAVAVEVLFHTPRANREQFPAVFIPR